MDLNHATWNIQQHSLQDALSDPEKHPEWRVLFLSQHAQLNTRKLSNDETWSFEDEVLGEMNDTNLRAIPPGGEHSIAWILWHLARCEDLTMNMLVGGIDQVYARQVWRDQLRTPIDHTGNAISVDEIMRFSQAIDLNSLKAYRLAVGESTRRVANQLTAYELKQTVNQKRMDDVRALGMVMDPAVLDYWSRRTIAGLLLMPPTRHCFTHLNEALRIKRALRAG